MRRPRSYARRGPVREPYDAVVIVCEGSKTEPYYFNRLRVVYRLSSANIKVMPADNSDPMSVVRCAESELIRGGYNRAYCVFDRNGHANYALALTTISQSQHRDRLFAITSVPCFEVWILLHYIFSTAPFTTVGNDSAGDRVFKEVRKHFPTYVKGYPQAFDDLLDKLEQAIKNGIQLEKHNIKTGSNNPATSVHILVDYLINLKQ